MPSPRPKRLMPYTQKKIDKKAGDISDKIGIYLEEVHGTVFFSKDEDLQKQIDRFLKKVGLTANQLLSINERINKD